MSLRFSNIAFKLIFWQILALVFILALVEGSDSEGGEKKTGSVFETLRIPGVLMICKSIFL